MHSKSIDVNMSYSFFNIFHENFHHEGRVCEGKSNKDTQLLYLVDLAHWHVVIVKVPRD